MVRSSEFDRIHRRLKAWRHFGWKGFASRALHDCLYSFHRAAVSENPPFPRHAYLARRASTARFRRLPPELRQAIEHGGPLQSSASAMMRRQIEAEHESERRLPMATLEHFAAWIGGRYCHSLAPSLVRLREACYWDPELFGRPFRDNCLNLWLAWTALTPAVKEKLLGGWSAAFDAPSAEALAKGSIVRRHLTIFSIGCGDAVMADQRFTAHLGNTEEVSLNVRAGVEQSEVISALAGMLEMAKDRWPEMIAMRPYQPRRLSNRFPPATGKKSGSLPEPCASNPAKKASAKAPLSAAAA